MEYTEKIQKAIKFAIKTHELYQKQKKRQRHCLHYPSFNSWHNFISNKSK